jgi:hypothetical protein
VRITNDTGNDDSLSLPGGPCLNHPGIPFREDGWYR